MPVGPNGERRPSNPIEAGIMVAQIAVGEIEEPGPPHPYEPEPPSQRPMAQTSRAGQHPTQPADRYALVQDAIQEVDDRSIEPTDGQWLEDLTIDIAPSIKEWDIVECYSWANWPDRESVFPESSEGDTGIDAVGIRSDGDLVAIQCKSRQLDSTGEGASIPKAEIDSFAFTSSGSAWSERWIVTNGSNPLAPNAVAAIGMADSPVKIFNIRKDLQDELASFASDDSKTAMQNEAVATSVRVLREHAKSDSGGLPVGQARGKIILPCGTGKTRISLRIVEQLTEPGGVSVVLSPSIALVAQIRREYLQHARLPLNVMAVCSDETAGYDRGRRGWTSIEDDPTAANSNVSANEVKGFVTTDSQKIADWIEASEDGGINVIFGTYQSGSKIAEALQVTERTADVLVADEAHRTAGLRARKAVDHLLPAA